MTNILSVRNLSVKMHNKTIVDNISFDIYPGEVVLLSGENGIGKSTVLKSILALETEEKMISGEILYKDYGNILELDQEGIQKYRSEIAYVPQRDEYAEMGNIQVRDLFSESSIAHSGKSMSYSKVDELIDEWIPRRSDNGRIFDAKSNPTKFSGGEQRLLSVFSTIVTRQDVDLLLIDEPLNNLDFANAKNISNLVNRIKRNNPNLAVLMVSHCRIFPFITREICLLRDGAHTVCGQYSCYSCIGSPDKDGYYR